MGELQQGLLRNTFVVLFHVHCLFFFYINSVISVVVGGNTVGYIHTNYTQHSWSLENILIVSVPPRHNSQAPNMPHWWTPRVLLAQLNVNCWGDQGGKDAQNGSKQGKWHLTSCNLSTLFERKKTHCFTERKERHGEAGVKEKHS